MIYIDKFDNGKIANVFHYDNGVLHRFNGPAVIIFKRDGSILRQKYYINGKIHRLDGPAYVENLKNGIFEQYFIKNRFINKNLWIKLHEQFSNKTFIYNCIQDDDKMCIVYSSLSKYYNWNEAHEYFERFKLLNKLLS